MIAQLQAAPAASGGVVSGQPSKKEAVEEFAALMQGVAGQDVASQPQPKDAKATAPEVDGATDALPEEADLETAEGLIALMDHTIAALQEGNSHVTPKAVRAAFAEALGEATTDEVGALEAVAKLEDPTLEAALEEKIAGALRLPTANSQLSVASAVVPAVGRLTMGATREQQAPSILMAGEATKQVTADLSRMSGPEMTRLDATVAANVDAAAEIADPRIAAADQFSAAVDTAKPAQSGVNTPAAEAALREVAALTAPQAPQPEALRLSPPQPTPAPAPNPAAAPEEQLRQHVSQQIRSLDTGDNKLRFSLSPYGMGEIEIEVVRTETGRMQIAMTTETASVLNLLRQDREQLLDALQSRGISAESADLDFQTFGERGRNGGQNAGPDLALHMPEADDAQGSDAQPSAQTPTPSMIAGQLDILT